MIRSFDFGLSGLPVSHTFALPTEEKRGDAIKTGRKRELARDSTLHASASISRELVFLRACLACLIRREHTSLDSRLPCFAKLLT